MIEERIKRLEENIAWGDEVALKTVVDFLKSVLAAIDEDAAQIKKLEKDKELLDYLDGLRPKGIEVVMRNLWGSTGWMLRTVSDTKSKPVVREAIDAHRKERGDVS